MRILKLDARPARPMPRTRSRWPVRHGWRGVAGMNAVAATSTHSVRVPAHGPPAPHCADTGPAGVAPGRSRPRALGGPAAAAPRRADAAEKGAGAPMA
ncbi:hypothetical protein QJS66_04295 [Kocuria rhizophila]|nr:hypothetical protein QJS66_04295 [Kocuria rhizophila]